MAVDTSIYGLSGRGVKSVNDYDTEYEQLLGLKQNRALGQMKMGEYQRGVKAAEEERAAYAQLMGQAGGDQTRAAQLLMGSTNPNLYAKGAAIQKAILDAEDKRSEIAKRGSDAKKNDTETRIKAHEFYIQQLGPVADMDGAQRWLNGAVTAGVMSMQEAQAGLAALQKMGPQGLGEWKSKALQGGMSALEQIRAAREAGAAADTRANQTLVPDGKGGYIPNQPLIAAKAAIARAGASNISMGLGSPVTVTGPNGEPMLVQPPTKAGGNAQVVTIDGMPVRPSTADRPLPEGANKQLIGTRNLQDAVGGYLSALKTWSNKDMLSPDARRVMGNAYNNMMLQAKEAYNLGVLNGPDYDILQRVVADPTNISSAVVSNDALATQAKELARISRGIERRVLEAHGRTGAPAKPSAGQVMKFDAQGNPVP